MPPRRSPHPTDRARLRALFEARTRTAEVSRITGLDKSTVCYYRRTMGFALVPRARLCRPEDVRALHAEGLVDRDVAARLGVCPSAVGRVRRRLGLAPHGKRAPSFKVRARAHFLRRVGAAGVRSIRQLAHCRIGKASRELAKRFGLPEDLPKLGVRIVCELLKGPATAHALADRLGRTRVPKSGYHRFGHAVIPGGNYLTHLSRRRGLIVRVPVAGGDALWALTPLALDLLAAAGKAGAA